MTTLGITYDIEFDAPQDNDRLDAAYDSMAANPQILSVDMATDGDCSVSVLLGVKVTAPGLDEEDLILDIAHDVTYKAFDGGSDSTYLLTTLKPLM